MARIGRIQVSCNYGDGSDPYVSTYRIVEIESAGKTFVGHTNEEGSQNGITWFDDVDLSLTSSLEGMYRFGGTNTYTWLAAMTEVPDEEVDIEYPISIANGGTGATTAVQALTNLGAAPLDHVHGNTVLWSGGSYMGSSHVANLSQKVSDQDHGIVLVFSGYDNTNNVALNSSWSTHFVPKEMIQYNGGGGQTFLMAINSAMSDFGSKYLYIEDNKILGHVSNTQAGTGASGITFSNNKYVMRYVIGF